jgi:hypothetical protein
MKKSIFKIAILFSLFGVALCSCIQNNNGSSQETTDPSGTYQLLMDGNTVAEGTSTIKVLMFDNTVNLGGTGSDFVVTITNVPGSIGGAVAIGSRDKSQLSIQGKNLLEKGTDEIYWAMSGTVTRTSASKISFEGTCRTDPTAVVHSFGGYVESDAYKLD